MFEAEARNFLIDPLRYVKGWVVDTLPLLHGAEGFGVNVKENPPSRGVGYSREVSFDKWRVDWAREVVLALGHQNVKDIECALWCWWEGIGRVPCPMAWVDEWVARAEVLVLFCGRGSRGLCFRVELAPSSLRVRFFPVAGRFVS